LAALAAFLLTVAALSLLRLRSRFSVSGRRSVRGALAPLGQKVICSWLCVLLTTTGDMAAAVAMGMIRKFMDIKLKKFLAKQVLKIANIGKSHIEGHRIAPFMFRVRSEN